MALPQSPKERQMLQAPQAGRKSSVDLGRRRRRKKHHMNPVRKNWPTAIDLRENLCSGKD